MIKVTDKIRAMRDRELASLRNDFLKPKDKKAPDKKLEGYGRGRYGKRGGECH